MKALWSEKQLAQVTLPSSLTEGSLAMQVREDAYRYGVDKVDLPGIFATLLGNVPDSTLVALQKKHLSEIANMTVHELMQLPGVTKTKAMKLSATFELARRLASALPVEQPKIRDPQDVADLLMGEMRHLQQEHFIVLLLNTKHTIINKKTVSIGTLNSTSVHPREVFKLAIRQGAAAIVLAHNHPSGDPKPSREDIDTTKRLIHTGKIVGIKVLDHIVIGNGKYVSIKKEGLIE